MGLLEIPSLRHALEVKETSAFLLFFATVPLIGAVQSIAEISDDNVNWEGDSLTFPAIALLLANLVVVLFCLANIGVSVNFLLGKGNFFWSVLAAALAYTSWFPYLVTIAFLIFTVSNFPEAGQPFIPSSYDPSETEVERVGGFAIVGFMAYAANSIGALTFFATKLARFQREEQLTVYNAGYYKSRQAYYGFLTLLAGLVQLILGAYVDNKFGDGRLTDPISAGPYFVQYPAGAIVVGAILILHGLLLIFRSLLSASKNASGDLFDTWSAFTFVAALGIQILLQTAPGPAAYAAGVGNIYNVLSLTIMPFYLDRKARLTPAMLESGFFSLEPEKGGEKLPLA